MTGDEFARLLARTFQAVVPPGFHVRADGSMLWFTAHPGVGYFGGTAGSQVVEHFFSRWGPPLIADRATVAAEMALDELQDYVDEESTEPWPGRTPSGPARPHAEVRDGKLCMWFGDEGAEVLTLEPIQIQETEFDKGR